MTPRYAVIAAERDREYAAHPMTGSPAGRGIPARVPGTPRTPKPRLQVVKEVAA